jgi:signal transduction histidine kinase
METMRSLARQAPGDDPVWRLIDGANWLAIRLTAPTGRAYIYAHSQAGLRGQAEAVLKSASVPTYFGVGIELVGVPLIMPAAKAGKPHLLAESFGRFPDSLKSPVYVKVFISLADANLLYAMERRRQWLFGGLIVCATATAFLGYWRSRCALRRQVQLNEMKSDFVSSVSHELRTPIASVRLMAESLERGKIGDPARQHEYFRIIGMECRRLSCLIENVLDFSRIEQSRKRYEFDSTDPVALVEQTVALLQPNAEERKVRLEVVLNQPPESAELDGKTMQQALINLIDNAIKHSQPGSVVTVGLGLIPAGEGNSCNGLSTLSFWVEDTGPGIPAGEHERIFERFYRLGSELRRETQGVGIGLSIVKHIAEAHGGWVRVRSEQGRGSRFSIDVPQQASNLSSETYPA